MRRGESCASWSRCRSSVHRMKAERIETLQIVRRVFLTFTRIIEANASSPSPIQTPTIVHNQLRGDVNCWDGPEPTAGMPVPEISVCPGTGSTSPPVLLEGCSTTPTASVGIPNWGRSVGSAFATRCASSAHTRMVSRRPGRLLWSTFDRLARGNMTTGGPADLRLGPTVAPPIPMILPSDTAKRSSTNVHCHNSFRSYFTGIIISCSSSNP